MAFHAGQRIEIPCEVAEGAFPGERLVNVDTTTGPVSGFVRDNEIRYDDEGNAYLIGTVKRMDGDVIVAVLRGSFFTTTGIAYFRKDMIARQVA